MPRLLLFAAVLACWCAPGAHSQGAAADAAHQQWHKHAKKHCNVEGAEVQPNGARRHAKLADARAACARDRARCRGVSDWGCDGNGPFLLCGRVVTAHAQQDRDARGRLPCVWAPHRDADAPDADDAAGASGKPKPSNAWKWRVAGLALLALAICGLTQRRATRARSYRTHAGGAGAAVAAGGGTAHGGVAPSGAAPASGQQPTPPQQQMVTVTATLKPTPAGPATAVGLAAPVAGIPLAVTRSVPTSAGTDAPLPAAGP